MFQFAQNGRNLFEHRFVPTIHLVKFALNMQNFEPPDCEAKALMQRPSARSPSVQAKCIAMVKTGKESQLTDCMSSRGQN